MIKRLVKLTFRANEIATFKVIFEESKNKIKAMEGCWHVELLQATAAPHIFFTLSLWENEQALDNYRASDLFATTWAKTKVLFADKPEAWSVNLINEGD
jgi:(4S)-4-hydroxy-5-phosphonooxypentane-2,3-dione isomerase